MLDKVVRDPGEGVARHEAADEEPGVEQGDGQREEDDGEAGTDEVQGASAALGVFAEVEGPELAKGGSRSSRSKATLKRVWTPGGRSANCLAAPGEATMRNGTISDELALFAVPHQAGRFFHLAIHFLPELYRGSFVHELVEHIVVRLATDLVGAKAPQGLRLYGDGGESGSEGCLHHDSH